MKALPALPLRAKDAVEHTLLHTVLRLDAQEVSYPDARDVECEIAQYQSTHQCHSPIDIALHGMRSHIDGMLHRPHLS